MLSRLALVLFAAFLPLALQADDTILATQKKLAQLGFYKGAADGEMGSVGSASDSSAGERAWPEEREL